MPWLSILPLLPLTYAVASLFQTAHDGREAGNQAFAIAEMWAFYGVVLVMLSKRLRIPGRVVLLAALAWMMAVAVVGNGRWADLTYRWSAYITVIGGAALTEAHPWGDRDELTGLNGLAAGWAVFAVIPFETTRLLEVSWRVPVGTPISLETLASQDRQVWLWTVGLWLAWAGAWWMVRRLVQNKEDTNANP